MRFVPIVEAGRVDLSRWDMRSIWMRPLRRGIKSEPVPRQKLEEAFARQLANDAPAPAPRDPAEAARRFLEDVRAGSAKGQAGNTD